MPSKYALLGNFQVDKYERAIIGPPSKKRAAIGPLSQNGQSAARHRKTGHYQPTSKMPDRLHLAGGPIVARD